MKQSTKYVGLDVHQATTVVSVREENGRVIARSIVPTEAMRLVEVFRQMRGAVQVAFEKGTQAQWLHDLLVPVVDRVVVGDGATALSDEQLAAIDAMRVLCVTPPPLESLTALARADREESIADWLKEHGVNESCAAPLAETGVTLAALETLAAAVGRHALDAALRWLSAGCQVRALSAEIENAGTRIYDLVAAVKGFSHMDRAPVPEPVDIRRGIRRHAHDGRREDAGQVRAGDGGSRQPAAARMRSGQSSTRCG